MRELGFGFVLAGQGPAKYLTKFLQLMELSRKFLQMRHLTGCNSLQEDKPESITGKRKDRE